MPQTQDKTVHKEVLDSTKGVMCFNRVKIYENGLH